MREEGQCCRQSTCKSRDLGVGQVGDKKMASLTGSERTPERMSVGSEERKVGGGDLCSWWGLTPSCGCSGSTRWVGPWGSLV